MRHEGWRDLELPGQGVLLLRHPRRVHQRRKDGPTLHLRSGDKLECFDNKNKSLSRVKFGSEPYQQRIDQSKQLKTRNALAYSAEA